MTNKEYQQTQIVLLFLAGAIRQLDLNGFIDAISLAETTRPILDPPLYRNAMDKLSLIKDLAQAARRLQVAANRLSGEGVE